MATHPYDERLAGNLIRQNSEIRYTTQVSVEQLERAILELSSEERQRLAVWFEENRSELLGDDEDELSDEQKAEVLRRRDLAAKHPELLEPWDGTVERVRARLNEFRRQKASAG